MSVGFSLKSECQTFSDMHVASKPVTAPAVVHFLRFNENFFEEMFTVKSINLNFANNMA